MRLHILLLVVLLLAVSTDQSPAAAERPPNIVIIFADDLGYGDLSCYGSPTIRTPNLDRMAAQGLRFTDFYSAGEVCTPSRAALLTGRYPIRSGMAGSAQRRVLFHYSTGGLPPEEITLAEALRDSGYATAQLGKWHLGFNEGSRPMDQGFDYSYWLPFSNDMDARPGLQGGASRRPDPPHDGWNFPLRRNAEIIEQPVDQTTLTRRYTEEAVRFVRAQRERPFFLYFAHTFPHVPLFASSRFKGTSRSGIYGDVVEELDWSVGQVLETLESEGQAENTLVFFTSDNGPWLRMGTQGGSAGPLREGKGSTWEGGMRVPGIAWWPGRIRPRITQQMATTMDLFTTSLALADVELPPDVIIDGRDIRPLLLDDRPLEETPFFYYRDHRLFAVRLGEWKAHFMTQDGYEQPQPKRHDPPLLFHLGRDPSERHNVVADHPDVLAAIEAAVRAHRSDLLPREPQY